MQIIRHDGKVIKHAEQKLWFYYFTNPKEQFDFIDSPCPNELTWKDREIVNKYMAGRIAKGAWSFIVSQSIKDIDTEWDLIDMTENEWKKCWGKVYGLLERFLTVKGIGCANFSKVLHLKRRRFVPMCDSIVVASLGVKYNRKKAETILDCMGKFREICCVNRSNIEKIRLFLERKETRLGKLSDLRIIEKLYWVDNFSPLQQVFRERGWSD